MQVYNDCAFLSKCIHGKTSEVREAMNGHDRHYLKAPSTLPPAQVRLLLEEAIVCVFDLLYTVIHIE